MWKMVEIILEKQFLKLLMVSLKKKVKTAARNISEKALCLMERRRSLYKNYLSDRSYENKRNVKKVEEAL